MPILAGAHCHVQHQKFLLYIVFPLLILTSMDSETLINIIFAIFFGLAFGSYATMAQYRIPHNRPWSSINLMEGDKIHCPNCKNQLHFKYWCPVFGYVRSRGKCVYCGMKVNPLYLFTELSITILSVVNVLLYGFEQHYIPMQLFGSCMMVLAVIEIEHRKIPDSILMTMLLAAIIIRMITVQDINMLVLSGMLAVAVGSIIRVLYAKITQRNHFSVAYVKLLAIGGILLPFPQFLLFTAITLILLGITAYSSWKRPSTPPYALPIIAAYVIVLYIAPLALHY
jgi:leader peptidase (prepilin peptidase)/N-methyltransferase